MLFAQNAFQIPCKHLGCEEFSYTNKQACIKMKEKKPSLVYECIKSFDHHAWENSSNLIMK